VELVYRVTDFIALGGGVLWVLFATCVLLWLLILERAWFLRITWPGRARKLVADWHARQDTRSWGARMIREALVSESALALHAQLPFIRIMVVVCPLLGLLGTVLGMISVFEVIAVSGNDDPQAMARGVYRATIPTMAGLVVGLTGIYFTVRLGRVADLAVTRLKEALAIEGQRA
jgi:biopolymer transport protein ExbB